jgi:hypothetical protein
VDDLSELLKKAGEDPAEQQVRGVGVLDKFYTFLEKRWRKTSSSVGPDAPWVRRLLAKDAWDGLDQGSNLVNIGTRFAQFDALADSFQSEYRLRLTTICSLALAFLICFEIYAHASPEYWLLGLALLLILSAYISLGPLRSREVQAGYLCSRCVAESLRIQFYFLASGFAPKTAEISNDFSERHASSISYVRPILKAIWAESSGMPQAVIDKTSVEKNWIKGQEKYFDRAIDRNGARARGLSVVSNAAFFFGVICIATLAVLAYIYQTKEIIPGPAVEILKRALLTCGPSLIAVAAILEFISDKRGFKAHAERYRDIRAIFSTVDPEASWESRIERIGLDCLGENIDWYVSSMQREITVPKG